MKGIANEPRSKVDKTPLHLACQEGHLEVVRHLLSNGADLTAVDMVCRFVDYSVNTLIFF